MSALSQQLLEQADAALKAGRHQELIPLYEQLEFQARFHKQQDALLSVHNCAEECSDLTTSVFIRVLPD